MPPKPQIFKAPDGTEFETKILWRNYMMSKYYSFKNIENQHEPPSLKLPDSIQGQMFDIGDCTNSTLVICDYTEQVQIDVLKDCKVFLGACSSSIFIRNCENCIFYTCCRQLRLRDVTNCTFYIYSMSEVHIEFSTGLKFAPFNGGYPQHADHLKQAKLDPSHNMWYDIYDHNDSGKTNHNWTLLPTTEYSEPWYPLGTPCEPALPLTKAGSVAKVVTSSENMQSFSLEQMKLDSQKNNDGLSITIEQAALSRQQSSTPMKPVAQLPSTTTNNNTNDNLLLPPPIPVMNSTTSTTTESVAVGPAVVVQSTNSIEDQINTIVKLFAEYKAGEDISVILDGSFTLINSSGDMLTLSDFIVTAPLIESYIWTIDRIIYAHPVVENTVAFISYWVTLGESTCLHCTAVLQRNSSTSFGWLLLHVQQSSERPLGLAPPPYYV